MIDCTLFLKKISQEKLSDLILRTEMGFYDPALQYQVVSADKAKELETSGELIINLWGLKIWGA